MHRLFVLSIALLALPLSASAQQVEMISAEGGVHILQEAGAILAGEDGAIIVRMKLPAGALPKDAEPVDLREGDRILMANKKRVRTIEEFQGIYEGLAVGDELKIGVKRGEQMLILAMPKAEPGEHGGRVMMMTADGPPPGGAPAPGGAQVRTFSMSGGPGGDVRPLFGAGLLLGAGEDGQGVKIVGKLPMMGEGHEDLGLAEGDSVVKLNGEPVADLDAFFKIYDALEVGAKAEIELARGGDELVVAFGKPDAPKPMMIRKSR